MKLDVYSDRAGYQLKEQIRGWLVAMQIECVNYDTHSEERCDCPDYMHQFALAIQMGVVNRGIAVCGMGNGMTMTLNKYNVIRVGLTWNEDIARLIRAYNDISVLVIPTRFIGTTGAERCLCALLDAPFEGGHHKERIDKVALPIC